MSIKTKAITTIALVFVLTITMGSCTPKVYLPVLYEAPGFTLTNQDSLKVKLSDFRDKVIVMDFIYTHCPDICEELNHRLQNVWESLGEELRQDLGFISVSFDPFDTPEVLKQYDNLYDVPGWQFLTGTEEQIHQIRNDYGVEAFAAEVSGVEIAHSVMVVLIDRDGMVRKTYGDPNFPEKDMIMELEYLLNQ